MRPRALSHLLFPLLLAACHNGLDVPGGTDQPGSCASATDEASCSRIAGCRVEPGCCGSSFGSCYPTGAKPTSPSCGCLDGNNGSACSSLGDKQACDANPNCHSTFLVVTTHTCTLDQVDCDVGFAACAKGAALCKAPAPDISDPPNCGGFDSAQYCGQDYVPEYGATTGCFVDCVRPAECG